MVLMHEAPKPPGHLAENRGGSMWAAHIDRSHVLVQPCADDTERADLCAELLSVNLRQFDPLLLVRSAKEIETLQERLRRSHDVIEAMRCFEDKVIDQYPWPIYEQLSKTLEGSAIAKRRRLKEIPEGTEEHKTALAQALKEMRDETERERELQDRWLKLEEEGDGGNPFA